MLKDLRKRTAEIEVRGETWKLSALTYSDLDDLMTRFPDPYQEFMTATSERPLRMVADNLKFVSALIAIACGYPGDAEAEEIAAGALNPIETSMILQKVTELTFSTGANPTQPPADPAETQSP